MERASDRFLNRNAVGVCCGGTRVEVVVVAEEFGAWVRAGPAEQKGGMGDECLFSEKGRNGRGSLPELRENRQLRWHTDFQDAD